MSKVVPQQKPGTSKQDYQTPPEFLIAVKERLHIEEFSWDLAASAENTVVPGPDKRYWDENDDAIVQDWHPIWGWQWCNPPYGEIGPWVHKAHLESSLHGSSIVMLVPASTGSNWWAGYVHNRAQVLFIRPRLTFVGAKDPYPKDLALLLYTPQRAHGYDLFRWK